MIQNALNILHDHSVFGDNVFDDDPICNIDDQSIMFDNDLFKSAKLDGDHFYHPLSKSDPEKLYYKTRSSEFQSFNKFPESFDLLDTDTSHESPMSIANQSSFPPHFNQAQTSNRNARSKSDLRILPRKNYCLRFRRLPLRINNQFHES